VSIGVVMVAPFDIAELLRPCRTFERAAGNVVEGGSMEGDGCALGVFEDDPIPN
jgi:hypothetical protein